MMIDGLIASTWINSLHPVINLIMINTDRRIYLVSCYFLSVTFRFRAAPLTNLLGVYHYICLLLVFLKIPSYNV